MLPEADFPRGNVRRDLRGHSLAIGPVAADRIPRGRRGQRPGLLYDESAPGFTPSKWPFVSVPSPDNAGTRFVLGGEREGMRSTVVDVAYRHVDTRMARLQQPLNSSYVAHSKPSSYVAHDLTFVLVAAFESARLCEYTTNSFHASPLEPP